MKISIVIPTLNEAPDIASRLRALSHLRDAGHEVILVDGNSADDTLKIATPLVDHVLRTSPGRALQMNVGAGAATGDIFLFLHADTSLPFEAASLVAQALEEDCGLVWGRFDVRLSGRQPLLRVVEWLINWRSRLSSTATGDQAIFVKRDVFGDAGGFPQIPLMEDIALSRKLKRIAKPACLHARVVTSSRRWERDGVLSTVFRMWRLRLAYFFGADPAKLASRYPHTRQHPS